MMTWYRMHPWVSDEFNTTIPSSQDKREKLIFSHFLSLKNREPLLPTPLGFHEASHSDSALQTQNPLPELGSSSSSPEVLSDDAVFSNRRPESERSRCEHISPDSWRRLSVWNGDHCSLFVNLEESETLGFCFWVLVHNFTIVAYILVADNMERTISVEEIYQSGSANLVTKSAGSSIKIDSIFIDLGNANTGIDSEKCEHFSLRGYVSEVRSKDWKKCWPFALDSIHNNSEEQNCKLPPLDVPKFRWSSCQNCLRQVGAECIVNEDGALLNTISKFKSFGTCRHRDATMLSLDFQQAANLNINESRQTDANPSLNVNSNGYHDLLCGDKGEKKTKIAISSPMIGCATGSGETVKDILNVMQQKCQTNLAFGSKCKGSLENHKPDSEDQVVDVRHNHLVKNNADMPTGVPDSINNFRSKHPCLELGECDYLSSESPEIFLGSASGSSHRRKTRKVRLLTELLGKNGDERTIIVRKEGPPKSATPDASTGEKSFSVPQGQVTIQGNVTSSLGHNRKRKLPEDKDWRCEETNSLKTACKKISSINKDAGITDAVVSSDLEGALTGAGLETSFKSNLINLKGDECPIIGKKKNKRSQISDDHLSLCPSREDVQKETLKKTGGPSKSNATDGVLFNFVNTAFTRREADPFLPVEKTEKSSLSNRKNMMRQDHDGHGFPIAGNDGMIIESLTSRQNAEVRGIGSNAVPLTSAQDALTEGGLPLSFTNCLSTQIVDGISPIMDGMASLMPWQGAFFKDEIMRKDPKTNHVRDSSFPSKSELDVHLLQGLHVDLGSKRISFPNEKLRKHRPQAEFGSYSLPHQMHYCGTSSNEKTVGNQENLLVTSEHSNHRAEMVSDQGALDDITMEIVELMAKNQYERCLPDAKTDKQSSISTSSVRNNQKLDLNKAYGSEEISIIEGDNTGKLIPRARNGRISKLTKGDKMGSTKQKSTDYFSQMDGNQYKSQLEQSCASTGFRLFAQFGEKPSNGVECSDTSSSRHGSAQNIRWSGNMVGNRSSHTTMQALVVCNACQSAPQQKGAHLWPSMMPNHLAFPCNIPQNGVDESINTNVNSGTPSSLLSGNMNGGGDGNFLNPSTSNFERHNRKFDSENLRRIPSDYPFACKHNGMRSLDLYSNETIPAMHLLGLMDAGFQSGVPVDLNGNQKFLRRASFLHNHHSEEFPGMVSGGYRTSNAATHPTSCCYGKNPQLRYFHEHLAAIPTAGASSSFQHDRTLKKDSTFPDQLSLKSQEKEKRKHSDSQLQNRNQRSQKTATSGDLSITCGSIPAHGMPKLILGAENFMFPTQFHAVDNAAKYKLKAQAVSGAVLPSKSSSKTGMCSGADLPSKSSPKTEICSFNRNPADFSVPEAGNAYMIRGEDLKFGRQSLCGNRRGLLKLSGNKRQRKLTATNEHLQNQTS